MKLPMIPFKIPSSLVGKASRLLAFTKVVSPELCLVGSIVTGVVCVITSCKATLKAEPEVRKAQEEVEKIKVETEQTTALVTPEQSREIRKVYVDAAVKIAKLYAVPAAFGVLSIGLNIGGNRILRKNLAAMTAAYAALYKSYEEYRKRVIEEWGADKDQEFMYGVRTQKVKCVDENGQPVTREVNEIDYKGRKPISQYARWFDCGIWDNVNKRWKWKNYEWKDSPSINKRKIRTAQVEANLKLQRDGFLFLNEVYKMLGLPLSAEGQIVGWTLDGGDGVVSFGVFEDDARQLPCNKAFINEQSPNALLDFNVDGPIIGKLAAFFGDEYTCKLLGSDI